jgi:Tfp pilus assembly protein PilF
MSVSVKTRLDVDTLDFLTVLKVTEFEDKVKLSHSSDELYTDIERADALESLGIAYFTNGNYIDALNSLEACISPQYRKLKTMKRLATIYTLVSVVRVESNIFIPVLKCISYALIHC